MLKKIITYEDFDGVERTEDFYFNFTTAELTSMELGVAGGLHEKLRKIIAAQNVTQVIHMFQDIILKAYGEKSEDGRRFIKSPELSKAFSETQAYSELYMELIRDENAAAAFINGVIPKVKSNASVIPENK